MPEVPLPAPTSPFIEIPLAPPPDDPNLIPPNVILNPPVPPPGAGEATICGAGEPTIAFSFPFNDTAPLIGMGESALRGSEVGFVEEVEGGGR